MHAMRQFAAAWVLPIDGVVSRDLQSLFWGIADGGYWGLSTTQSTEVGKAAKTRRAVLVAVHRLAVEECARVLPPSSTTSTRSAASRFGIRCAIDPRVTPTFDGIAGIALFIGEAGLATKDCRLLSSAHLLMWVAIRAGRSVTPFNHSFFSGRLGITVVALRIAEIVDDKPLHRAALELIGCQRLAAETDRGLDVLSGAAGAIPALLSLGARLRRDQLIDYAARLGKQMLRRAQHEPGGWSWPSDERIRYRNLTGFGHGASGYASGLAQLYSVVGDPGFAVGCTRAVEYERQFLTTSGNWLDTRHHALVRQLQNTGAPESTDSWAQCRRTEVSNETRPGWCYGAAGIAISRLRVAQALGDTAARKECDIALAAARAAMPSMRDASFLHGIAGILEAHLVSYSASNALADWLAARQCGDSLLAASEKSMDWKESFSLGRAGVGLSLLRLACPAVPLLIPGSCQIQPEPESLPTRTASHARINSAERIDARRFFPKTFAILCQTARLPTSRVAVDMGAARVAARPDKLFDAISSLISDSSGDLAAYLRDAFEGERLRFALWRSVNDQTQSRIALVTSNVAFENWQGTRWARTPWASCIEYHWDWQHWLRAPRLLRRPRESKWRFLLSIVDSVPALKRLSTVQNDVFEILAAGPATGLSIANELRRSGNPGTRRKIPLYVVRRTLRRLIDFGAVEPAD